MLSISDVRQSCGLSLSKLAAAMSISPQALHQKERRPTKVITTLANILWVTYLRDDPEDGWRRAAMLLPPKPPKRKRKGSLIVVVKPSKQPTPAPD